MTNLTHGSLFAGIGGFDLGFQWAGIKTLWAVEIDPYCQKVLSKNFPETEILTDVREVGKNNLKAVDIISGGFPCQDISVAGKQAGITGARSGLWTEFYRIIGELRPRFAVIENVGNLVRLGLSRVLCDLAEIGYDAEWQIISANDVGAPHKRERIWIVAYPNEIRFNECRPIQGGTEGQEQPPNNNIKKRENGDLSFINMGQDMAYPQGTDNRNVRQNIRPTGGEVNASINPSGAGRGNDRSCERPDVADPSVENDRSGNAREVKRQESELGESGGRDNIPNSHRLNGNNGRHGTSEIFGEQGQQSPELSGSESPAFHGWTVEPNVGRVAHGIPRRVDRLKGLGNAVIPEIPEIIGHRLIEITYD